MDNNYYQNAGSDERFKPISTWGHIGYDILFVIPLIGFIMAIIYAMDDSYIARRNYARSKFCGLILILPMMIIIMILAAIVMSASTNTVGNAQFARFAQEFGEYSDQISLDAANVRINCGLKGQTINNAQMFYMTAHGYDSIDENDGVAAYKIPVGYELTINSSDVEKNVLKDILSDSYYSNYDDEEDTLVAYVVNDGKISYRSRYGDNDTDGSASYEYYGDSNGKEYHFVTSNGQVFTLPGYSVPHQDGTVEYHIDSKFKHSYVVSGNSRLKIGDTNVNGDVVRASRPIQASDLSNIKGIDKDDNVVSKLAGSEPKTNTIGK